MSGSVPPPTLLLSRGDVARIFSPADALQAVREAFRMLGDGSAPVPTMAAIHADAGGFHFKAALLPGGAGYFVGKTNANFMGNRSRHGLPNIIGTVLVCDAETGCPLALLDSSELTLRRTAAATALAAQHLARPASSTLAMIGCGTQGAAHVAALREVLPIRRLVLHDRDPASARGLQSAIGDELEIEIADHARGAASGADVCVTCTPSTEFILRRDDVPAGAFVAGVGADAEHKRELAPDLLVGSRVVVDVLGQCLRYGDLHHAVEDGALTAEDVHAELGQIVVGERPGRTDDEQITVFDSTGMALQDATSAALVYERARAAGVGVEFDFAA